METKPRRELTTADYLAMLRRHWVLILVLALIGPPVGYGVSHLLPNRYKSQTLVLIEPPHVSGELVPQVDITSLGQRLASMQQQILSRSRLAQIVHQTDLGGSDKESVNKLIDQLQDAINVTAVQPMLESGARDMPGFFVNVTLPDPTTAQKVCTAVTSLFIGENNRIQQQHAEQTTQFLSAQLTQAKADLDAQDAKLAAFKSRYMGSLPDEESTNLNVLTGLTSQLDATNQALSRAQQDKSFAESMLTQQLATWQASQSGQESPGALENQLATLQAQLASLRLRYTDDYPDVVKLKHDVALLQERIAEAGDAKDAKSAPNVAKTQKSSGEPLQVTQWRTQIHTAEETIAEKTREQEQIKKQIAMYQSRVQGSPAVEEQYKELTRGYQTALNSYNDLLKKRTESAMSGELSREEQTEQFVVLDPANLPDQPSFPKRPLFALGGLFGGLAIGCGITLLLELQDTSLRSERDVEHSLGLPVLAMVPAIEPLGGRKPNGSAVRGLADSHLGLDAGA
ncbi:MAG TPA: Wzz/FepE/Etk N-terminal domain-containing protein [Candidatus Acidoferrales bacterium]|nr:Wzz/FepE/Etk N-terminal domain-containing protein [Candidatus Acidoferrales bacterium]